MGCCQQHNDNINNEFQVENEQEYYNQNANNEILESGLVRARNPAFNKIIEMEVDDLSPNPNFNSNYDISMNNYVTANTNHVIKNSTLLEDATLNINILRNDGLNKNIFNEENVNLDLNNIKENNDDQKDPIKNTNINYNKSIILSVVESKHQEISKSIRINPIINTSNRENICCHYFGYEDNSQKNGENNYFNFNKEDGLKERHFIIKMFDSLDQIPGYYIKNINGSSLFMNISEQTLVRDNMIISFGSNYILITISSVLLKANENDVSETLEKISVITFKIIKGQNIGEE